MIAFALFLIVVGVERVMSSNRWPRLAPVRAKWHFWTPKAKAYMRSAPGTFTYLFVLVITTWVLQTSTSRVAKTLLLASSTNLHHLVIDPMPVLFGSAFWVSGGDELLLTLVLFIVFAARVERWLGTARTVTVFFIGHIGATLLVALWLWASLNFAVVRSPVTNAQDVGASYGFAALVGILAFRRSGPRRWIYIGIAIIFIAIYLAFQPSFTNWGHGLALVIGLSCYFMIPRRLRAT
jgi:hypothetical protein